jgi:hypothetical protein
MRIKCHFDARDICIACEFGNLRYWHGSPHAVIDSGEYIFPAGFNPIGMSASDLWPYRIVLQSLTIVSP